VEMVGSVREEPEVRAEGPWLSMELLDRGA
jgi:hypothetical protein